MAVTSQTESTVRRFFPAFFREVRALTTPEICFGVLLAIAAFAFKHYFQGGLSWRDASTVVVPAIWAMCAFCIYYGIRAAWILRKEDLKAWRDWTPALPEAKLLQPTKPSSLTLVGTASVWTLFLVAVIWITVVVVPHSTVQSPHSEQSDSLKKAPSQSITSLPSRSAKLQGIDESRSGDRRQEVLPRFTVHSLYLGCNVMGLPIPLAAGVSFYVISLSGNGSGGIAGMIPQKPMDYDFGRKNTFGEMVYRCDLTNDNAVAMFRISVPLTIRVREVVRGANELTTPSGVKITSSGQGGTMILSGETVRSYTHKLRIDRLGASGDSYRFYVWNASEYFIDFIPPKQAKAEINGVNISPKLRIKAGSDVIGLAPSKTE